MSDVVVVDRRLILLAEAYCNHDCENCIVIEKLGYCPLDAIFLTGRRQTKKVAKDIKLMVEIMEKERDIL